MEEEQIPDDYNNLVGQLPLKCLVIRLERERDGELLDELKIDRISYESAIGDEEE